MDIINMQCESCISRAEYICKCSGLLCGGHITSHGSNCKVFNIRKIENEDKLKVLPIKLSQRIQKIDEISSEIINKTQELLVKIENLCSKSVSKLKILKLKYMKILENRIIDDIEEELNKDMIEIKVLDPEISLIESYYGKEFYKEKKIEFSNIEEAMKWLKNKFDFSIQDYQSFVRSLAITHNNRYVVIGKTDGALEIWNIKQKKVETTLKGHTYSISSIAITYDDKFIVSGCSGGSLIVWNFKKKVQEALLQNIYGSNLHAIAISHDNKYIISCENSYTVKIWNFQTKSQESNVNVGIATTAIAITYDNKYFIIKSGNNQNASLSVWNIKDKRQEYNTIYKNDTENIWLKKYPEINLLF